MLTRSSLRHPSRMRMSLWTSRSSHHRRSWWVRRSNLQCFHRQSDRDSCRLRSSRKCRSRRCTSMRSSLHRPSRKTTYWSSYRTNHLTGTWNCLCSRLRYLGLDPDRARHWGIGWRSRGSMSRLARTRPHSCRLDRLQGCRCRTGRCSSHTYPSIRRHRGLRKKSWFPPNHRTCRCHRCRSRHSSRLHPMRTGRYYS